MGIKWSRVSRRRELRVVNAERVSNGRIPMIQPSDWLIDWLIIGRLVYPHVTVTQSTRRALLIVMISSTSHGWWYSMMDIASYAGWIMQQLLLLVVRKKCAMQKLHDGKGRCNLVLLISFQSGKTRRPHLFFFFNIHL